MVTDKHVHSKHEPGQQNRVPGTGWSENTITSDDIGKKNTRVACSLNPLQKGLVSKTQQKLTKKSKRPDYRTLSPERTLLHVGSSE